MDWCLRNSFKACLYTCLTPARPPIPGLVLYIPPLPSLSSPPLPSSLSQIGSHV